MDSSRSLQLSRHLTSRMRQSATQFQLLSRQSRAQRTLHLRPQTRHASNKADPNKPIILEQPDKFRPPSHPQRLNARRTTAPLMSGSYNQGATQAELAAQKTKRYPHMFPPEGTVMHRFLTNKAIHVWISLGILTTLALFTLSTTFLKTSPFAHLLPPLSTLPFHPIRYTRELFSILKLHIDYTTEQTAQKRQQAILDAQKRRLYRRAHGMEDLDAKEDTGVDVRGLVGWDDGLTGAERAKGGRDRSGGMLSGKQILEAGGEGALREAERRREEVERGERETVGTLEEIVMAANAGGAGLTGVVAGGDGMEGLEGEKQQQQPRRKVKRWLGIWE